jgi:anti-sigma regulatory factor (Ser/Thr protein kinase)
VPADENAAASYFTVPLPDGGNAPELARKYLAEHASWLEPDVLADALLIVSELVTNAVRYGRPEIVLSVSNNPPRVGVVVEDAGIEMPIPASAAPDATEPNGRGLLIVDALADGWGVLPREPPPGKSIWFELGHRPDVG